MAQRIETGRELRSRSRKYAWGRLTVWADHTNQLYYSIDAGERHPVPFQFSAWRDAFAVVNDYLRRQN